MRQGDHYNASDTRSNSPNYGTSYQEIGHDLMIRCIVYTGMTESEEALLFAQQVGEAPKLTPGDKMCAMIYGGAPECMAFLKAIESVGLRLDYAQRRGKHRIGCGGSTAK